MKLQKLCGVCFFIWYALSIDASDTTQNKRPNSRGCIVSFTADVKMYDGGSDLKSKRLSKKDFKNCEQDKDELSSDSEPDCGEFPFSIPQRCDKTQAEAKEPSRSRQSFFDIKLAELERTQQQLAQVDSNVFTFQIIQTKEVNDAQSKLLKENFSKIQQRAHENISKDDDSDSDDGF